MRKLLSCWYRALRAMWRMSSPGYRFQRDRQGVVAVEAAICFPVMLLLVLGTFQVGAMILQTMATNFTAEACAAAGARALAQQQSAQAACEAVYSANAGLFIMGSSPTLGSVTVNGQTVTATVTAQMAAMFPILGLPKSLTATATATD